MHKSLKFDYLMDQPNFFVKEFRKIGPKVNICKPTSSGIRDKTCNRSSIMVPMSMDHYERRSMLMGRSFTLVQVRILLSGVLPLRVFGIEELLAMVEWIELKKHRAYVSYAKRKLRLRT